MNGFRKAGSRAGAGAETTDACGFRFNANRSLRTSFCILFKRRFLAMIVQSATANQIEGWILPIAITAFVVFAIASIFASRVVMRRLTAGWLRDFPAQPIDATAQWRSPGYIT